MPNLLPNWTLTLPWDLGDFNTREAGRLIWSIVLLIIGIAIVAALMKQPKLKRPFSTKVGGALFPAIIVGTLLLAKLVPSFQRTIILLGFVVLVAHMFLMIGSREARDPEEPATWAECFAGAVGVFALMALGYAIVPSEFLTFANASLEWGDSSKFVFQSGHEIFGVLPVDWPFNFDYPALRDLGVTLIYGVLLVVNLKFFVMWQNRHQVAAATDDEAPPKRSRFGRPLRKAAPQAAVTAPVTTSATASPEGA
jgi:uncharacterized membrane protein HdeD (DUF308 family)